MNTVKKIVGLLAIASCVAPAFGGIEEEINKTRISAENIAKTINKQLGNTNTLLNTIINKSPRYEKILDEYRKTANNAVTEWNATNNNINYIAQGKSRTINKAILAIDTFNTNHANTNTILTSFLKTANSILEKNPNINQKSIESIIKLSAEEGKGVINHANNKIENLLSTRYVLIAGGGIVGGSIISLTTSGILIALFCKWLFADNLSRETSSV